MNPLPCLLVAGPTASGKSEFAVELAEHVRGEIVCADAFQIYAGLAALTAAPGPELLLRCPHHLYGSVPPGETHDAGKFLAAAHPVLADIRARGRLPVVTGGTGLFFRALVLGFSPVPPSDPALRAELECQSAETLAQRLAKLDPATWERIDRQNPRRVLRALEICLLAGRPASEIQVAPAVQEREWPGVWIDRNPAELAARIEQRTREMLDGPAVEEVRAWRGRIGRTAAKAIGFQEISAWLDSELTREEAVDKICVATRQYAKRQRTWFRNQTGLRRFVLTGKSAAHEAAELAECTCSGGP